MKKYFCRYVEFPVKIDGDFEKPVWRKADSVDFYIPVSGDKPSSVTEAGLLWDNNYLYAGFKAYDKDIFAYNTERDSVTCEDDVLEIFFKTQPEKEPYYNFEINALNTVYDAYNLKRFAAGGDHRWKRWNCNGLKSAVKIKGTINQPFDIDEFWQLEVAIPFKEINLGGGKKCPEHGDVWTFLLARYDYSVYIDKGLELSATSFLSEVNFHRYEEWDELVFIRK